MSAWIYGAAVLAGGLLAARHISRLADTPDIHDVFTDDDLILGGRLTIALHEEAERLTKKEGR